MQEVEAEDVIEQGYTTALTLLKEINKLATESSVEDLHAISVLSSAYQRIVSQ